MKSKSLLFLILSLPLLSAANINSRSSVKPKSIILFIGDGMGVAQVTAAVMNGVGDNFLRFPRGGLVLTRSSDSWITDSASSATAMAAGKRTYNRAIGVDDNKTPLKSVFEYAEEKGMSTGLVATSSVTHATPASFATHVDSRYKELEIARQLSESQVDVIIGGGMKYFLPESEDGERKDNRNLLMEMKGRGFSVMTDMNDLVSLDIEKVDKLIALLMFEEIDKENHPEQNLADMTEAAIKLLKKNDNGFFLMVEGSQIDWEAHDNEYDKMLFQLSDFNDALGVALDYSSIIDDLLIVVTADHETGGLTLLEGKRRNSGFKPEWSTHGHTGNLVPILAVGPGSDRFGGILNVDEIGRIFISLIESRE
ncbi:MAG: alkaline phosphatase [Candidatus Marinimicrobia bacterium]|nr:alkaline phosphatase [Candidatus Neomarinimicrobiota bacterium]